MGKFQKGIVEKELFGDNLVIKGRSCHKCCSELPSLNFKVKDGLSYKSGVLCEICGATIVVHVDYIRLNSYLALRTKTKEIENHSYDEWQDALGDKYMVPTGSRGSDFDIWHIRSLCYYIVTYKHYERYVDQRKWIPRFQCTEVMCGFLDTPRYSHKDAIREYLNNYYDTRYSPVEIIDVLYDTIENRRSIDYSHTKYYYDGKVISL